MLGGVATEPLPRPSSPQSTEKQESRASMENRGTVNRRNRERERVTTGTFRGSFFQLFGFDMEWHEWAPSFLEFQDAIHCEVTLKNYPQESILHLLASSAVS